MTVKEIQQALAQLGYSVGEIDGDYGKRTTAAVVAFQKAAGLYPDGVAGPKTQIALKAAMSPVSAVAAPPRQSCSAIGLKALIGREALKTTAYLDSVGVWTIGVGHTAAAGAPIPYRGLVISRLEAEAIFARDLIQYEDAVRRSIKIGLADHQFDALTSICFNIGPGGFSGSTFVKRINEGASEAVIHAGIMAWKKPPEIITRRLGEAEQFATPYSKAMPRARSSDKARISL